MRQQTMHTMTRQAMPATDVPGALRRHALRSRAGVAAGPRLDQWLLGAVFLALVALASWPGAREASATFGWTPLWLLATPASAWLALQLRRIVRPADAVPAVARRRRFGGAAAVPATRRSPRIRRVADRARSA